MRSVSEESVALLRGWRWLLTSPGLVGMVPSAFDGILLIWGEAAYFSHSAGDFGLSENESLIFILGML